MPSMMCSVLLLTVTQVEYANSIRPAVRNHTCNIGASSHNWVDTPDKPKHVSECNDEGASDKFVFSEEELNWLTSCVPEIQTNNQTAICEEYVKRLNLIKKSEREFKRKSQQAISVSKYNRAYAVACFVGVALLCIGACFYIAYKCGGVNPDFNGEDHDTEGRKNKAKAAGQNSKRSLSLSHLSREEIIELKQKSLNRSRQEIRPQRSKGHCPNQNFVILPAQNGRSSRTELLSPRKENKVPHDNQAPSAPQKPSLPDQQLTSQSSGYPSAPPCYTENLNDEPGPIETVVTIEPPSYEKTLEYKMKELIDSVQ